MDGEAASSTRKHTTAILKSHGFQRVNVEDGGGALRQVWARSDSHTVTTLTIAGPSSGEHHGTVRNFVRNSVGERPAMPLVSTENRFPLRTPDGVVEIDVTPKVA